MDEPTLWEDSKVHTPIPMRLERCRLAETTPPSSPLSSLFLSSQGFCASPQSSFRRLNFGNSASQRSIMRLNLSEINNPVRIQLNSLGIELDLINEEQFEHSNLLASLAVALPKKRPNRFNTSTTQRFILGSFGWEKPRARGKKH